MQLRLLIVLAGGLASPLVLGLLGIWCNPRLRRPSGLLSALTPGGRCSMGMVTGVNWATYQGAIIRISVGETLVVIQWGWSSSLLGKGTNSTTSTPFSDISFTRGGSFMGSPLGLGLLSLLGGWYSTLKLGDLLCCT